MRRSGSKTGAQRRRSSGSLKFGLLSVHETKILPTKNANFSFEPGSKNPNTRGGQGHQQGFPSTFPPDETKQRMSTAHDPIPIPSSHIHRTASELNLIVGEKHAVKREELMFQRLVSGMVRKPSDQTTTVSVATSSATQKLADAESASKRLLQNVTTKQDATTSATSADHDDSAAIVADQDEFFVGSFRDYAKLTPPKLLKLQEAALGIDAPLPTDRRRSSKMKSDRSSEIEFTDADDEVFPLDL